MIYKAPKSDWTESVCLNQYGLRHHCQLSAVDWRLRFYLVLQLFCLETLSLRWLLRDSLLRLHVLAVLAWADPVGGTGGTCPPPQTSIKYSSIGLYFGWFDERSQQLIIFDHSQYSWQLCWLWSNFDWLSGVTMNWPRPASRSDCLTHNHLVQDRKKASRKLTTNKYPV